MKNRVLVVGGGMVGAATALELARQNCRVTLLETKIPDVEAVLNSERVDIRVSAINRFSENLLARLGAWQAIAGVRAAAYEQLQAYEQRLPGLLFDAREIGQTYLGHIIENNLIQAALWRRFGEAGIEVHSPEGEPLQVEQTGDEVTLHYADCSYSANLLVAADGGQSRIRQLAGIGVTGWQYGQSCMGVLIKLDAPQQAITWQQFQPTGPVAFLPMQAPYANLIWYHSPERLRELKALSPEKLKAEILAHFPDLPGDVEVIQSAVFPLARQHANSYTAGRIVLVGDAAHTINPLAGQGVNLGFQDVAELGQRLADCQDKGTPSALKAYERARRLPNLTMMSMMDACYFGFSNQLGPLQWLRNRVLQLADRAGPIKHQVLRYAIGELNE